MSARRGVLACSREFVGGFSYIGEHVVLLELVFTLSKGCLPLTSSDKILVDRNIHCEGYARHI